MQGTNIEMFILRIIPACLMLWYNKDISFPLVNLGGLLL